MLTRIAIDGPVGSGKSSISKALAQKLGFIYVDTGALYRATAFYCKTKNVDVADAVAVEAAIHGLLTLDISVVDGTQRIYANRIDVTDEIRTEEISMMASTVSKIPFVREFLLEMQRDTARDNSVVMDGRDIGTVILPDAEVKIYLTADDMERAGRRYKELALKGATVTFQEVLDELRRRDYQDMNREIAPLKQAVDAVLVDSTNLTFEEVVEKIYDIVMAKTS